MFTFGAEYSKFLTTREREDGKDPDRFLEKNLGFFGSCHRKKTGTVSLAGGIMFPLLLAPLLPTYVIHAVSFFPDKCT